jgi:GNAT superfamily N-acetyltransferase
MSTPIRYDLISTPDDREVYALVERGFDEFVRDDCTKEGAGVFFEAVRYILFDKPDNYFVIVAKQDDIVLGMIAVADRHHISLFFVDRAHQGRRIGRGLFEAALARCRAANPSLEVVDVHSSLFAVPIYERLGFERQGGAELKNGVRFVKLVYMVG